jgi:toxin ParE1/3/4
VKPIHRREEVITDLAELYAWIGERNPRAADRFLSAVEVAFAQIARNPGIGWERPWKQFRLAGMRSWRIAEFPNFLIFYREEADTIQIYAVLRGARHLERALWAR